MPSSSPFCPYAHILGEPRKGFHAYRFMDYAIFDVVGTVIIALLLSRYLDKPLIPTLLVLFIVATILHLLFCVNTKFVNSVLNIHYDN